MKIGSVSFLIFSNLKIKLIWTSSGHRFAFLESLMAMEELHVLIILEIIFIILLFKMNNFHKIQLKLLKKASGSVRGIS